VGGGVGGGRDMKKNNRNKTDDNQKTKYSCVQVRGVILVLDLS
jgi:hypothetical protein